MKPSALLLKVVSALLLLAAGLWILRLYPELASGWFNPDNLQWFIALIAICLGLAVLTDLAAAWRFIDVDVSRQLVGALSQGTQNVYGLRISNQSPWTLHLSARDGLPVSFNNPQQEIFLDVPAGGEFVQRVDITPAQRGDFTLHPAWIVAESRWGFWNRRLRRGGLQDVQVYPNFSMLRSGPELGLEDQIRRMGVHRVQRRGRGMDFHQLREFVAGDAPTQVDWKASSRFNKLIAREYQDDRDQRIFFLLDGGHRMRAEDQGFSLFDHAVNALLVTAHIALKQGDSVGFVSFAGQRKWIHPAKGRNGMKLLLNQTYNLQSTTETSDYLQMAGEFMRKQPKRSLVILITSVHADDLSDLRASVQLLRQSHLVMIVTVMEPFVADLERLDMVDAESARHYASMVDFQLSRTHLISQLRAAGVVAAETTVAGLSATIAREYLQMKRAGKM